MKDKKAYQYPWRDNNSFQILIDGAEYFSTMLDEIKKAEQHILFEAYLFQSGNTADKFIHELCSAKQRGVEVFVLLDEYGSKGLNEKDKQTLINKGINVFSYHPVSYLNIGRSLKRDHRKLLIIDDTVAFVGGAGITDYFSSDINPNYWHDVMLKVQGEVVSDLSHSFCHIWGEKNPPFPSFTTKKFIKTTQEDNNARVIISSGAEKNEIIRAIITHIRSSKDRVWLTSPYFISSWKIRRALRYAAKKGVDVRLIFPGAISDHKWVTYGIQRYYQRLLKANVTIYEYQPRFSHAKIILCDDWFTIGSSNFDRWNQFLNLDLNIEVFNSEANRKVVELFDDDFSKSKLIVLNKWNTRSLLQHTKEWFAGIMIIVLGYISKKFKR